MKYFLCLDSALGAGSAALYGGGDLLDFREIPEKGGQAKYLVSIIQECLASKQLSPEQLGHIYCAVGPGGFTGIRIAMAAAQAYGFTLNIPTAGVSTLACLATHGETTIKIPAGRDKCYTQTFEQPALIPTSNIELVAHDGELEMPGINAKDVGALVQHTTFKEHHQLALEPLYIRPPDAKLPSKKASG